MQKKALLALTAFLALITILPAQVDLTYQEPPAEIMALADVTLPPSVRISSKHDYALLMYRDQYLSIAELSTPEMRLAGLRVNPKTHAGSRLRYMKGLSVLSLRSNEEKKVSGLPSSAKLAYFSWSPDQRYMAFTHSSEAGMELWLLDMARASAARLTDIHLNGTMGQPYVWAEAGQALLLKALPGDRQALIDTGEEIPTGPTVSTNEGEKAQNPTYQDLLKNKNDEFNFEQLARSELLRVDLDGHVSPWMKSAIYDDILPSPDGRYVLVTAISQPFSYIVPYYRFPSTTLIADQNGKALSTFLEVPLLEVLPKGNMAVQQGKRSVNWRNDQPASLYWVEALDQGDPEVKAEFRDEVFTLPAPFTAEKRSLIKLHNRFGGITWGDANLAVAIDYWWNTRNLKTYLFSPDAAETKATLIFDRNYQDRYSNPGYFATRDNAFGKPVLEQLDGNLFLIGDGYSAHGVRPFVDRYLVKSKQSKRLWQADGKTTLEEIVDLRDLSKGLLITRIQSKDQYPNYYFRTIGRKAPKALTRFANPFSALAKVKKEVISYKRDDGLSLSGTLYLPVNYEQGKRYPMIMWAYPQEFKDKNTASQVSSSPNEFIFPSYGTPLYWLTRGYVVLDDAAFPIVGEGKEEPNDSFIKQLVANAKAAIDAVDARGCIDRNKVAVGGHSYGAFMTANLLTHSNLFAAGIARSGAYNRTLTPFGFQSEERNYWEAPQVYNAMSPFMNAEKMKTPLLLIHGAADNNSGTFTLQSERYFNALKGLGATVRLVLLPKESHGYTARESVLHLLWEQDQWLEKYVKNRPQ